MELLTLSGNVVIAKYTEVKAVFFVRDFDPADILAQRFSAVPSWMASGCG